MTECKHDWQLLTETTTISKFEVLLQSNAFAIATPDNPTDRKHIQVFSCKNCGKLKRFVEDI